MTIMTPVPNGWRVTCEEHSLDRYVDTDEHAMNLFALHQREDHPATTERHLLPAEAARFVLLVLDDSALDESHRVVARGVWEQLTGLHADEAVTYARDLAARPGVTLAHIPPEPF